MRRTHLPLILIYCVCFAAGAYWLCQWAKFRGVEKWPSVEAVILKERGNSVPYRFEYKDGTHSGTSRSSAVEFEYLVDGQTYRGDLGTPDGEAPLHQVGRAFYKLGSPEIAVLDPLPYRGTGYLMAFLVCGIIVGTHLYLTLAEKLCVLRLRKAVAKRAQTGA